MIEELFSTPIYTHKSTFDEVFLVQNELKNALDDIRSNDVFEKPKGWEEDCSTNIGHRFNTILDYGLDNMKKFLAKHVTEYVSTVNPFITADADYFLNHSWIAITGKGQSQEWHAHTDAIVSGVYYYQTNGEDGDLWFRNPVPYTRIGLFPAGASSPEKVHVKPRVGNLVLFPGWLEHKVCVNTTDHERIVVSFNYNLRTIEREGLTNYKRVGDDLMIKKVTKD